MKRSDLEKPKKRHVSIRKHLNNFQSGFEKLSDLLLQSQEYITELERELQHARQENKLLSIELKRFKKKAPPSSGNNAAFERRRSGSVEDLAPIDRTKSLDESFRKVSAAAAASRAAAANKSKSTSTTPEHGNQTSRRGASPEDDADDDDDDDYDFDELVKTPQKRVPSVAAQGTPSRAALDTPSRSTVDTPRSAALLQRSSYKDQDAGGDTSGDESVGSFTNVGNAIVQRLALRICADPEIRAALGFSSELVLPPMEVRSVFFFFFMYFCAHEKRELLWLQQCAAGGRKQEAAKQKQEEMFGRSLFHVIPNIM